MIQLFLLKLNKSMVGINFRLSISILIFNLLDLLDGV